MVTFYSGVAGRRPGKPTFAIIHNDAGSINATASYYSHWLPTHQAELGFAHVYIAKDGRYQAENYDNIAWHAGNGYANQWALSWEVCQSLGATDADFKATEERVFQDVANAFKQYGLVPNRTTVRLHREYSATDCPHRSWALHGQAVQAVQDYFIAGIQRYMGGGSTSTGNEYTSQNTTYTLNKELLDMYLIFTVDTKRWYVSNGVGVRYVRTTRMLANYQDNFGKLQLPTDKMYQVELDKEFGAAATKP